MSQIATKHRPLLAAVLTLGKLLESSCLHHDEGNVNIYYMQTSPVSSDYELKVHISIGNQVIVDNDHE